MALSPYETQAILNLQRYLRQLSRFDPDISSVDEDGIVYECPIKPARVSDKTALNMFLR